MFTTLKQLWQILTPLDKRKLLLVLALVMIMALIEAAGVVSIMPFLAVLSNPQIIESNAILQNLYALFSSDTPQQFIMYLGILSLIVVVTSTCVKILAFLVCSDIIYQHDSSKFIYNKTMSFLYSVIVPH